MANLVYSLTFPPVWFQTQRFKSLYFKNVCKCVLNKCVTTASAGFIVVKHSALLSWFTKLQKIQQLAFMRHTNWLQHTPAYSQFSYYIFHM